MRSIRSLLAILVIFAMLTGGAAAQSFEDLAAHYSGQVARDGSKVTFLTSGEIVFNDTSRGFIWKVPPEIDHILLADNVTLNGALHLYGDCTIEGENRERSGFFGTDTPSWPQRRRDIKAYQICTIQAYGEGTIHVRNLTFRNPRGFHIRGEESPVHVENCTFLESRPGSGNHSDGFEGGKGSTVHNCYFQSGDDIIKVYNDLTVTSTTIVMSRNAVPIQFGWGNYGDGAHGVFRDVKIYGDWGRGPLYPVMQAHDGRYKKSVLLENCMINNPEGALFDLRDPQGDITVVIENSNINLKQYGVSRARLSATICGETFGPEAEKSAWNCGGPEPLVMKLAREE
jgi:hypothetical protein